MDKSSKRIAVLSPVAWRTPPRAYGAWETVANNITKGLVRRGWEATLFATQDSVTDAQLHAVIEHGYEEDPELDPKVCECLHISEVMERAGDFDLIHNNYDFLPLTYSRLINTPMLTTIHGFSSPRVLRVYRKYKETHFVFEKWFGFFGFFSFVACLTLVLVARLVRHVLRREEDYYDH